jgi:hypothetical protein
MSYYKDLLAKKGKSTLSLLGGVLFILIAIAVLLSEKSETGKPDALDWIYLFVFSLNGIIYITRGFGYPAERYFGKAFVLIDNEKIQIKPGVIEKKKSIEWEDIDYIEYRLNKYIIRKNDHSTVKIPLSRFDYATLNEIKEVINKLASQKNVKSNF